MHFFFLFELAPYTQIPNSHTPTLSQLCIRIYQYYDQVLLGSMLTDLSRISFFLYPSFLL